MMLMFAVLHKNMDEEDTTTGDSSSPWLYPGNTRHTSTSTEYESRLLFLLNSQVKHWLSRKISDDPDVGIVRFYFSGHGNEEGDLCFGTQGRISAETFFHDSLEKALVARYVNLVRRELDEISGEMLKGTPDHSSTKQLKIWDSLDIDLTLDSCYSGNWVERLAEVKDNFLRNVVEGEMLKQKVEEMKAAMKFRLGTWGLPPHSEEICNNMEVSFADVTLSVSILVATDSDAGTPGVNSLTSWALAHGQVEGAAGSLNLREQRLEQHAGSRERRVRLRRTKNSSSSRCRDFRNGTRIRRPHGSLSTVYSTARTNICICRVERIFLCLRTSKRAIASREDERQKKPQSWYR